MPEEGVQLTKKDNLLNSDEIIRLINLFAKLGVNKIRFTGKKKIIALIKINFYNLKVVNH